MSIKSPVPSPDLPRDSVKNIYANVEKAYESARKADNLPDAGLHQLQAEAFQNELLRLGGDAVVKLFGEPFRELLQYLRLPKRSKGQMIRGSTFFAFDIFTFDAKYRAGLSLPADTFALLDKPPASRYGAMLGPQKMQLYGDNFGEKIVYVVMLDDKFIELVRAEIHQDADSDAKATFVGLTEREAERGVVPRPTMPSPASDPHVVGDVRRSAADAVSVATRRFPNVLPGSEGDAPASETAETVPFRDDVPEPNLDPARKLELIADGPPSTVTPSRLEKNEDEK